MTPSPADAEDLAQDVLLRSYQAIDRFDGSYPRAWLYRIARNGAISRARHRGRVEFAADPAESILERLPAGGRPPDAAVLDQSLDGLLEQALDNLSPRHRAVVDLVDIHGLSYNEAATARPSTPSGSSSPSRPAWSVVHLSAQFLGPAPSRHRRGRTRSMARPDPAVTPQ